MRPVFADPKTDFAEALAQIELKAGTHKIIAEVAPTEDS